MICQSKQDLYLTLAEGFQTDRIDTEFTNFTQAFPWNIKINDAIEGHLPLGVYYKSLTGQLIINVLYVD